LKYGAALKIGIFGGTFNPPHLGHLRLAEEVGPLFGLDRILFVPCHIPPHKTGSDVTKPEERLEMTRLACGDNPLFEVSDMEIAVQGMSYTVKTLETLAGQAQWERFFIMGTDSLREIGAWKDYERLFALAHFIVVQRPGVDFRSAWAELPEQSRRSFREDGGQMIHDTSMRVIPAQVLGLEISSTRIRKLVQQAKSVRYLVTESVRSYIISRNLYRNQ
jgi:nicotinate-nucleotide adenylyltransferase